MSEKLTQTNEKFNAAVGKLAALLGGDQHLKANGRVANKEISSIVTELLAEREAKTKALVKEKLSKALDGYVELEKELKAKRAELEKLEIQKKEEYVKTIEDLAKNIESIDELANMYAKGLAAVPASTDKP